MKAIRIVIAAAGSVLLAGAAQAQVSISWARWTPSLDAQARIVDNGIGATFDFAKDLGMKDERVGQFRVAWRTGRRSFVAAEYDNVNYSGDQVVQRTIEYNGEVYEVGTRVRSSLDVETARLQWAWQFLATRDGSVRFGPMLEAAAVSFDDRLMAPDLEPQQISVDSLDAVFPAIGLALDVEPLPWFALYARGSVLDLGSDGSYRNAEAGARVFLGRHLSGLVGYRDLDMKASSDPDWAEIRLKGPYVGVSVEF